MVILAAFYARFPRLWMISRQSWNFSQTRILCAYDSVDTGSRKTTVIQILWQCVHKPSNFDFLSFLSEDLQQYFRIFLEDRTKIKNVRTLSKF